MKYSVNPNLNAVMNSIEKQLLSKGKDKQESCLLYTSDAADEL